MYTKNIEDIIKDVHKRILEEIESLSEIEYSPAWPIKMYLDHTGKYYIYDPRWDENIIEGNLDEKMINEFKRRAIIRSLFHILGGRMEGYAIVLGDGRVLCL